MHRYTIFLLLILSLVLGSVGAWAQGTPSDPPPANEPIIVTDPPTQMITGEQEWQPIELTEITELNESFLDSPLADSATDICTAAPPLTITELQGDGGQVDVNNFEVEGSDPILSCRWNGPAQGYRTAWYYFVATSNGHVLLQTVNNNHPYDTILAVHSGSCGAFTEIACSDDSNGFFSEVTITVRKGETYYVEIADWNPFAPTTKTLSLLAWMKPIVSNWTLETYMPQALTRHATAVSGNSIYVIGGQKSNLGTVDISNSLWRYNTVTDSWKALQDMPGTGYANTTAVQINGRIYVPSGYVGGAYDMTHWVYDIAGNVWFELAAIPNTTPFAWAAAVPLANGNGYYVTGGLNAIDTANSADDVRSEVHFYSITGQSWQLLQQPMNDARYAHTAAMVNNRVCVVGGLKHDGTNQILLPDGECYTGSSWSPIAPMNIPRYMAASTVGPNGKWYVFGGLGVDSNGKIYAVSETEMYDPISNTWTLLPVNDDLGGTISLPARAWPRGGRVGSTFWALGGNNIEQQPLSFVESLFLPTRSVLLPVIMSNFGGDSLPDDNFADARPLAFNVPQYHNFNNNEDFYDVFYFDLKTLASVTVRLSQIPNDSNYDVFVYNSQKELRGAGENVFLGMSETVKTSLLPAGRYYIMVKRIEPLGIPNKADYRIIVEK